MSWRQLCLQAQLQRRLLNLLKRLLKLRSNKLKLKLKLKLKQMERRCGGAIHILGVWTADLAQDA